VTMWVRLRIGCASMARQTVQQTQPSKPKSVKRDPVASGERDAAQNRAASHNYFLLEKFEAGLMLRGTEVKSVRAGQVHPKDAFRPVKNEEAWFLNSPIGPYQHGNHL